MIPVSMIAVHDAFDAIKQFPHILAVMGDCGEKTVRLENTGNMGHHFRKEIKGVAAKDEIESMIFKGCDKGHISRKKTALDTGACTGLQE